MDLEKVKLEPHDPGEAGASTELLTAMPDGEGIWGHWAVVRHLPTGILGLRNSPWY